MAAYGIIGLDLGVTTGMAWGIFNPALRDEVGLWRALARGKMTGYGQPHSEDILGLGVLVSVKVLNFIGECQLRGIPKQNVRICIEDFQARPNQVRGGKAQDKLAPVYLAGIVDCALHAAKWEGQRQYFDPSLTKSKAEDKRLKQWAYYTRPRGKMGWIKGQQHARDACRLVAVGLEKIV